MKYKILINGQKAALAKDFFQQTKHYFKCLITTNYLDDILNHFEFFQPDAYICFIDTLESEIISQIYKLQENNIMDNTKTIVILNNDISGVFSKLHPCIADLTIKRPISADNIALKITRFFEEIKEAKEAEEAAKPYAEQNTQQNIEAAAADTQTAENADKDEKKSILIVDDDRNVLKMLKAALSETYNITTMANGILVEKFFETKTADLIILDYEMPIQTGAEVFRKIKNNEKIKNIPVCFLTAVNEAEKIREIMQLKPHGYLLKPINMEILLSTISNLID